MQYVSGSADRRYELPSIGLAVTVIRGELESIVESGVREIIPPVPVTQAKRALRALANLTPDALPWSHTVGEHTYYIARSENP